ncbi:MAG: DinB family protein [Candidatus Tectomicrobia bacterium]|nr:DinB family protein [Candidatus Tectomicrobia bacterium]
MSSFQESILNGLEGLQHALEGLTSAEARWQPTLYTNHIAWLVWHMARGEDAWRSRLQESPQVWTSEGWAGRFHMDPVSVGVGHTMDEVRSMPDISLTDLMAYLDAVRAVTRHYLAHATDADLAREYNHPRLGTITGAWSVGHILVEVSQHVGQVELLRGMMREVGWRGLPGGRGSEHRQ